MCCSLISIYYVYLYLYLIQTIPSSYSFPAGLRLSPHPSVGHVRTTSFLTTESSKYPSAFRTTILLDGVKSNDVDGGNHDDISTTKSNSTIPSIPLLFANSKCIPSQMSPTSLAYIGDVVYEMCVRCRYVWPSRRTSDLQNVVVAKVRGAFSRHTLECLQFQHALHT